MPASRRTDRSLAKRASGSLGPPPSCPDLLTSAPRDQDQELLSFKTSKALCRPHPQFPRIPPLLCGSAGSSTDGPPSWPWPPLPCPSFPAACSPGNPGQSSGAGIQGLGLPPSPLAFLPFPVRNFSPLSLVTITLVGPGPSAQRCVPRAQKAGLGPRRAGTCAGPA